MMLPMIPGLQRDAWQNISNAGRWSTVRNVEKQLAAQENRPAAEVLPMPGEMRQLDENGQPAVLGLYDGNKNTIYIEPTLVADPQPYRAVETTFHEARHAYQEHAIANPGFHNNPQQVEDWRVNNEPNVYYSGDPNETDHHQEQTDYALYRWQPVEDDAVKIARERTNELYEGRFQDQPGYAEYKAGRERQLAWDRQQGEATFGTPEVEEIGRQATYERYDQSLMEQAEQEAAQGSSTEPQMTPDEASRPHFGAEKEDAGKSTQPKASEVSASEQAEGEAAEAQQQATQLQKTTEAQQPESEQQTEQPQQDVEARNVASQQQPMPSQTAQRTPTTGRAPTTEQAVEQQASNSASQAAEQASTESASHDAGAGEAAGESEGYDYGYGYG